MAKIVVREGRNVDWEYVFPPDKRRVVMGRRTANEVPVGDAKASRNHAEIIVDGGRYILRDLKSRNGTLLNYQPVRADEDLEFGDRIRIGDTVFELIDETKNEPITLEIPGYDILERIGLGGMGTVFRARQISMDRVVALKVLNESYGKDQQFIERFIREARAAGRLSHPNVIHVHDVSEENGVHYFSMEYVDGTTVKRLLKRRGKMEVDKALDITLQTAKALEYAHENNIIHRDIKPDNLMLTKDGVVKVADLGIAKTLHDASESGQSRRVFGTPHYMAPEQALGKEIDARADVYGLGATFYHMLTGSTPFQGNTVTDILKAHIQTPLPPIREKAPDVPGSVVAIVERMMAKTTDGRYADMGKTIEALEEVTAEREAEAEGAPAGDSPAGTTPPGVKGAAKDAAAKQAGAKKRERSGRPGAMPVWQKALIGVGAVVGLIALFAVTYLVANSFLAPGQTAGEKLQAAREAARDGRTDEAIRLADEILREHAGTDEAAEAKILLDELADAAVAGGLDRSEAGPELEKVKELEKSDGPAPALVAAKDLLDRDPPASVARELRGIIERLEAALAKAAEQEAADALDRALAYGESNRDDLRGRLERLSSVAREYPETPSGRRAEREADAIEKRITTEGEREARQDFDQAQTRERDARGRGDYDAAIQAYDTFLARHGDSSVAPEARARKQGLEKEIEAAFNETKAAAERQVKSGHFGQALAKIDRFIKSHVSQRWDPAARKLLADTETKVEEAFQKARGKARSAALSFEYDDAAGHYSLLANRFGGTRWSDLSRSRAKQVRAERALHRELVRRVNAEAAAAGASPRALPFVPPGVPAAMQNRKWYIVSASERELTLYPGREKDFQSPVRWAAFAGDRLLDVVEIYFPKATATADEHLAMAYLCEERGLDARAQLHYQAAPP